MIKGTGSYFCPDVVFPPGDTLQETLEFIGMTQIELAERLGRPEKTISEIIKGKTAITPGTALQLERVLGVPAEFWQNLEQEYRIYKARMCESKALEEQTGWLDSVPVKEMIHLGWIPSTANKTDQLRSVLQFFGMASTDSWTNWYAAPQAAYRKSRAFESNPGAVAAWLRAGEIEAQKIQSAPFVRQSFEEALAVIRGLTREKPEMFVPKMKSLCSDAGVVVVFTRDLPKTRVCGAARWLTKDKALIQLGLRYKTDDHLWFTFFHEAGHILLHGKKEIFVEEVDPEKEEYEQEADSFAANCLIPAKHYRRLLGLKGTNGFRESVVRAFAEEIGIAPGIVVGRLQYDKFIPFTHLNSLKAHYQWA